MRLWASGVSVLTTRGDGGIRGLTVSAFCSVSLNPPLVLACIDKKTKTHGLIRTHRAFAVNVLKEEQERLSELAAGRLGPDGGALEGWPHREEVTGAPVLNDVLAWFDCSLRDMHDAGDHTIYVGLVEAAGHEPGRPLLYQDRDYRRLARSRPSRPR